MEGIWRLSETRVGIELLGQLKNNCDLIYFYESLSDPSGADLTVAFLLLLV